MALGLVYVVSHLNLKRPLSKTILSTLQGIIVIFINKGAYWLFQLLWFFFFSISCIFPELYKYIFSCILPAPTHYSNLCVQSLSTLGPWKRHWTSGPFSHKFCSFLPRWGRVHLQHRWWIKHSIKPSSYVWTLIPHSSSNLNQSFRDRISAWKWAFTLLAMSATLGKIPPCVSYYIWSFLGFRCSWNLTDEN